MDLGAAFERVYDGYGRCSGTHDACCGLRNSFRKLLFTLAGSRASSAGRDAAAADQVTTLEHGGTCRSHERRQCCEFVFVLDRAFIILAAHIAASVGSTGVGITESTPLRARMLLGQAERECARMQDRAFGTVYNVLACKNH